MQQTAENIEFEKRLPERWRKNFLVWEFWLSVLVAIGVAVWGYFFGGTKIIESLLVVTRSEIYNLLASLFGSLFGFAIAATSIVLGVSRSPRLYVVRLNEYRHQLWDVLFSAIKVLGVATTLAVLGLMFDDQNSPTWWLLYLNIAAIICVILRLGRCIWILENVVRIVAGDLGGSEPQDCEDSKESSSNSNQDTS